MAEQLIQEQVTEKDGIVYARTLETYDGTRQSLWNTIGKNYYGSHIAEEALEQKSEHSAATPNPFQPLGGLWNKFPNALNVSSVLEIGCGFGRVPAFLSQNKSFSCDTYFALDLSEPLLKRFRIFRAHFPFLTNSDICLLRADASALPLTDNSIDLVLSNSVFMHLPAAEVKSSLAEIARVLKPGGKLFFANSFHNRDCTAHRVASALRLFASPSKRQIYNSTYTRAELNNLLLESGLTQKVGPIEISATGEHLVIPFELFGMRVPGARLINRSINPKHGPVERTAYAFGVCSENIYQP